MGLFMCICCFRDLQYSKRKVYCSVRWSRIVLVLALRTRTTKCGLHCPNFTVYGFSGDPKTLKYGSFVLISSAYRKKDFIGPDRLDLVSIPDYSLEKIEESNFASNMRSIRASFRQPKEQKTKDSPSFSELTPDAVV